MTDHDKLAAYPRSHHVVTSSSYSAAARLGLSVTHVPRSSSSVSFSTSSIHNLINILFSIRYYATGSRLGRVGLGLYVSAKYNAVSMTAFFAAHDSLLCYFHPMGILQQSRSHFFTFDGRIPTLTSAQNRLAFPLTRMLMNLLPVYSTLPCNNSVICHVNHMTFVISALPPTSLAQCGKLVLPPVHYGIIQLL